METKSLLYGLIGFFAGGLLVSLVATSTEKPTADVKREVTMGEMTERLKNARGDEYDKLFIDHMIEHHQGAIDMAKLSDERAKHQRIKDLSRNIVTAQQKEITQMKQWQVDWGYVPQQGHDQMNH